MKSNFSMHGELLAIVACVSFFGAVGGTALTMKFFPDDRAGNVVMISSAGAVSPSKTRAKTMIESEDSLKTGLKIPELMQPCRDDIEKFCFDVPRGQNRIKKCLKTRREQLSSACANVVDQELGD